MEKAPGVSEKLLSVFKHVFLLRPLCKIHEIGWMSPQSIPLHT